MCNTNNSTEAVRSAMWANDIVFCPQMGKLTVAAVAKLISQRVFSANAMFTALLRERYKMMKNNFDAEPHESNKWEQTIEGHVCQAVYDSGKPDARLAVPSRYIGSNDSKIMPLYSARNFGTDMPVWFNRREARKDAPRIMLVAQDPLRDGDSDGNLYVSSPWAFHSCDFRHKIRMRIPFLLVTHLLERGMYLYLTDAFKIFAEDYKYSKVTIRPNFHQVFQDVLRAEIEMFNPSVVVAIGEASSRAVMALGEQKEEIEYWTVAVIPRPSIKLVHVVGRSVPCVLSVHFSRVSSYRTSLAADANYYFTDDIGNENYLQYYVRAIDRAINDQQRESQGEITL